MKVVGNGLSSPVADRPPTWRSPKLSVTARSGSERIENARLRRCLSSSLSEAVSGETATISPPSSVTPLFTVWRPVSSERASRFGGFSHSDDYLGGIIA
jgi:hypothetical protein